MKITYFFIVFITIISVTCRNEIVKSKESESVRVKVTSIMAEKISIPVHSTGLLSSSEEIKLSFKTGGIVAGIPVKEGEIVKRGEIIAFLNLSEIDAQVNLADIGYDKAVRDYTRAENLFADSVATLEQMQNASTALKASKSNLDIAMFNKLHSKITAPDNGVILKQFVKTNEMVGPGFPVFLFGTSGKNWKIKASLSDRDIVKINIGDSANVTLDAYPGTRFSAVVDQVGKMSNPMTGTYETELRLSETDNKLASGFVASLEIFPAKRESYVTVPVGAIVEADGQDAYIFTVTDSLTAEKLKIDIVNIIGAKAAVKGIREGITEVVSEGAAYLKNGIKVKVVK
jgi:membrane fusion protein, multidrug efflux system